MTNREETYDAQTKELYRAIGEYAVAFERINLEIWQCIKWLLQAAGLRDPNITEILLAKYTADPLHELLKSLIGHMRPPNTKEEKIIGDLFKRHKKIIEDRNNYLHGFWDIGYGNERTTDWSVAKGFKLDRKAEGVNVKRFSKTSADFDELIKEVNAINAAFHRLNGCFRMLTAVEKNFDIDDKGRVSVPSQNSIRS